jgi:hypothetical protein
MTGTTSDEHRGPAEWRVAWETLAHMTTPHAHLVEAAVLRAQAWGVLPRAARCGVPYAGWVRFDDLSGDAQAAKCWTADHLSHDQG